MFVAAAAVAGGIIYWDLSREGGAVCSNSDLTISLIPLARRRMNGFGAASSEAERCDSGKLIFGKEASVVCFH